MTVCVVCSFLCVCGVRVSYLAHSKHSADGLYSIVPLVVLCGITIVICALPYIQIVQS